MIRLAQKLKDPMSRLNNGLMVGDAKEIVTLLQEPMVSAKSLMWVIVS
jgi:hypothetical protein